jgi:hypothetical protein
MAPAADLRCISGKTLRDSTSRRSDRQADDCSACLSRSAAFRAAWLVGGDVLGGVDRRDAGACQRLGLFDRHDFRMGMGRAQEHGVGREGPRVCRLAAGGRWIRTIGPATEKLRSAPQVSAHGSASSERHLIPRGTKNSNPASSSGESNANPTGWTITYLGHDAAPLFEFFWE